MPSSSTPLDGFELLAETLGELASRHLPDGRYTYVSTNSRELVGYEPEELVGRQSLDFIHPDDVDYVRGAHAALLKENDQVDVRYRYRCKDGAYKWLLWTAIAKPDEEII